LWRQDARVTVAIVGDTLIHMGAAAASTCAYSDTVIMEVPFHSRSHHVRYARAYRAARR
jgi:hypothetical protein